MKNAIQHLLQQRALLQKEYAYEKPRFSAKLKLWVLAAK